MDSGALLRASSLDAHPHSFTPHFLFLPHLLFMSWPLFSALREAAKQLRWHYPRSSLSLGAASRAQPYLSYHTQHRHAQLQKQSREKRMGRQGQKVKGRRLRIKYRLADTQVSKCWQVLLMKVNKEKIKSRYLVNIKNINSLLYILYIQPSYNVAVV